MADQVTSSDMSTILLSINTGKAGLASNLDGVTKIIGDLSKGTPFYDHKLDKEKKVKEEIELGRIKLNKLTPQMKIEAKAAADKYIETLENSRDMSRIIVHIDMDMFFAAVEIRDNPSLNGKPVAVGSMSMLSTTNYEARKFGATSAMPGFIGKRLCPDLQIIAPNFKKYGEASERVMEVLSEYDPDYSSPSMDEARLDITDFVRCKFTQLYPDSSCEFQNIVPDEMWNVAADIVTEIRQKVFSQVKLTCSAGVASNLMLAKICSNTNKPNGQFILKCTKADDVIEFMKEMPVKKICGIGPMQSQVLHGFNISKCNDIWANRDILKYLFSEITVAFYLRVCRGLSSNVVRDEETNQRSKSHERTFSPTADINILLNEMKAISEELSQSLKSRNLMGKTITLKVKRASFAILTRCKSINHFTDDGNVILKVAKNLLIGVIQEGLDTQRKLDIEIRLLGIKMSNFDFESSKKSGNRKFSMFEFCKSEERKKNVEEKINMLEIPEIVSNEMRSNTKETLVRQEGDLMLHEKHDLLSDGFSDFEDYSSEVDYSSNSDFPSAQNIDETAGPSNSSELDESSTSSPTDLSYDFTKKLQCPICDRKRKFKNVTDLNDHISWCINRDAILEVVNESFKVDASPPASSSKSKMTSSSQKKRKSNASHSQTPTKSRSIKDYFKPN